MTSSKRLIDNNFLTTALDIGSLYVITQFSIFFRLIPKLILFADFEFSLTAKMTLSITWYQGLGYLLDCFKNFPVYKVKQLKRWNIKESNCPSEVFINQRGSYPEILE